MNYSTAVFLINSNVRAVMCTYEAEDNAKRTAFKTLDNKIREGDFVIVPTDTRHKMTICKVVETDVDVDFDSPHNMQWIVGSVEQSTYQKVLAQEAEAIATIKSAEKTKKRNELRAAMLADSNDALKALPITVMGETAAVPIEPPPAAPDYPF
jgi:hypothetical protein